MSKRPNTANTPPQTGRYTLSAIAPRSSAMESSGERMSAGNKYVEWGFGNQYPAYLRDLYLDVATLETIINGTVDYVQGNSITCNVERFAERINGAGDTIAELVERLATDYLIYGGFAFAVIRALDGSVGQLEYQDLETVRSNEDNTIFYVAQSWRKGTRVKAIELPKFGAEDSNPRSLVYVKGSKTRGVYPIPVWNVKAAEIERKIGDFHLSNLDNGFAAARIFKFHSGVPDDDTKAQIERGIEEKFCGPRNAGRVLIEFTDGKEYDLEVETLEDDNLDKKYESTRAWSERKLYTSFRAIPCLFGLMTENNGFSREEFLQAFELYNQTVVAPIQRLITRTFDKVFGMTNSITIEPFALASTKNLSDDGEGTTN